MDSPHRGSEPAAEMDAAGTGAAGMDADRAGAGMEADRAGAGMEADRAGAEMDADRAGAGMDADRAGAEMDADQADAAGVTGAQAAEPATGMLHHVELWVPDLTRATATWGWLLGELGYQPFQRWAGGRSWRAGPTYIVVEQSPDRTALRHDRRRPGLNHLAFHVASRGRVDEIAAAAPGHGWRLMFTDRHPFAGGHHHYAAYLENVDGYEAELVGPPLAQ